MQAWCSGMPGKGPFRRELKTFGLMVGSVQQARKNGTVTMAVTESCPCTKGCPTPKGRAVLSPSA